MPDGRSFARALVLAALSVSLGAGRAALAEDGPKPADPPKDAPPATAPKEPKGAPETAPAGEAPKYSWKRVGIGTVLVLKISIQGESMAQSQRYTLVSVGETSAKVKMDMLGPDGATVFSTEQDVPLMIVMDGQEVVEKKTEKIDVGAGSFECDYMKVKSSEGGQELTAELWLVADLPLPVKAIARSPAFTSTMELVKVEKK